MTALLALDTATERVHLALGIGDRVRVRDEAGSAQASVTVLPAIFALLQEADTPIARLDAIAFGQGPGAFTGLRTACAVAQGLSLGARLPVLALDTLMAVAEDARQRHGDERVWVAMDARMDEVFAAEYQRAGERWRATCAPALYTLEALHARWRERPPACVAGSAINAFGARLQVGNAATRPDAQPRGDALLALARAAWRDGKALDASQALPVYLRDKVALTTDERAALKAAKQGIAP
jgi:tRNA threonylcarbamoyladenosine biosynthesis protein TsaB